MGGFLLLAAGALAPVQAQEPPVKMEVQFLNSEALGEVNLNQEEFISYGKALNDSLESMAAKVPGRHDLYVTQTLHYDQPATVLLFCRPALSGALAQRLQARLAAIPSPLSRFVDYSLLFKAVVRGGAADAKAAFVPELQLPEQREQVAFKQLDLAGQYRYIRQWAARQALPVLAAFETKVEDKFAGVKGMGKLVAGTDATRPLDVAALTDRNNDYWRGCLEMSRGNQLLPLTKVMLYAAQGEFDRADLYLKLLDPVSDPKAAPTQLAQELHWHIAQFTEGVNAEIQQGIALHDAGKYDQAQAQYSRLLATYPASAWANYERFLTERAATLKKGSVDSAQWHRAAAVVYSHNPMYPQSAQASSAKEGYQLLKRMRLTELFKDKTKFAADYAEYANIALRLGEYGLAAQLDWVLFSLFSDKKAGDDARLADFLYCLDKLGNQEIRENFKGDFPKQFATTAARLDREMQQDASYKAFKK